MTIHEDPEKWLVEVDLGFLQGLPSDINPKMHGMSNFKHLTCPQCKTAFFAVIATQRALGFGCQRCNYEFFIDFNILGPVKYEYVGKDKINILS